MIPKDPAILLSYVNTQLRDYYDSLDELCFVKKINKQKLQKDLEAIDYYYNNDQNQFI
ncbi:MAG: DUF4250 domain-containing protein [Lachnospiraceae bacterium]